MINKRVAIAAFAVCTAAAVLTPAVARSQDRQGSDAVRSGDGDGQGDATVAGTQYSATASIPCANVGGQSPTCSAGVSRSPEQIAIEIEIPNGKRLLLFDGKGKFVTHGSAEADGSAGLISSSRRDGDWTVVSVGKEQYRIPDAFILGD